MLRRRLKPATPPKKRHLLDRRADQISALGESVPDDQLLDTRAVARWLGVSTQWLELVRGQGHGPPFIKITPKLVRYDKAAVLAWLKSREQLAVGEGGA